MKFSFQGHFMEFYGLCLQVHCIETLFGNGVYVISYRSMWVSPVLTIRDSYELMMTLELLIFMVISSFSAYWLFFWYWNLTSIIIHSKEFNQVWCSWIFDRVMAIWIDHNSHIANQVSCSGCFRANISQSYKYTLQQDMQAYILPFHDWYH
jgi:hypothetical protein